MPPGCTPAFGDPSWCILAVLARLLELPGLQGGDFTRKLTQNAPPESPRTLPGPAELVVLPRKNVGLAKITLFRASPLKMLSEGPLGSEITPFWSLLGPLSHHLGPIWEPFGCRMAPPGTPWVPQVGARAPQSHSLWHKSSPEGPQGRPGCPPAPHFGRFSVIWGGHSEGFGVPLGVTSGQGGARLGGRPFCRKL